MLLCISSASTVMAGALQAGWQAGWPLCYLRTGLHARLAAPCSTGLHEKQTLPTIAQAI